MDNAPIKAEPLTTADLYDPKVKAAAYDAYLNRAMTLDEIGVLIGVENRVIMSWARSGKWSARKAELERELMQSAELKFQRWNLENKQKTAEKQLRDADILQEAIMKAVEDKTKNNGVMTDMSLKRIAEALSAVTGVSARAVGLSENGMDNTNTLGPGGRGGKQPLIIIGVQPTLAAEDPGRPAAITVTEVKMEEVLPAQPEDPASAGPA